MNPRQLAKASLEGALTVTGVAAAGRKLRRDHVAILAYHNVVPDHEAGPGDASLHLPLSRFLAQLDALQETHDFVDLPTAMAGGGGRIRATVTFDDAYRGAVRLALPELRKRGIPATMFVCPGLLDEPGLWWDETAEAGRLTPDARARAMYESAGSWTRCANGPSDGNGPDAPRHLRGRVGGGAPGPGAGRDRPWRARLGPRVSSGARDRCPARGPRPDAGVAEVLPRSDRALAGAALWRGHP